MMQFSDQASVIGIMAVEGYHAGAIRELLIRQAYNRVVYDTMLVTNLTAVRVTSWPNIKPLPPAWWTVHASRPCLHTNLLPHRPARNLRTAISSCP